MLSNAIANAKQCRSILMLSNANVCFFVCNRGDSFMSQDGLRTRKLCQSPMPDHCCNSGIIRGTSPRCFPYTITRLLLKSQHVMRDTALEFGPPSGTQCLKWLQNVQKVTSVGNPFLALVGIPSIVKLSNFTM